HAAGRLADDNGNGPRLLRDGRGRPVPGAQTARKRDALCRRVDIHAGRLGDAVPPDDDRSLQLRNVLDLLSHAPVADVPFLAAGALEGVEIQRPSHRQHLVRVADDEHGADRLSFAAFTADLGGQIDDGPENFQGNLEIEFAQVGGTEAFEVFAQVDQAEAIDVL